LNKDELHNLFETGYGAKLYNILTSEDPGMQIKCTAEYIRHFAEFRTVVSKVDSSHNTLVY